VLLIWCTINTKDVMLNYTEGPDGITCMHDEADYSGEYHIVVSCI
jgi:hypothetical protein